MITLDDIVDIIEANVGEGYDRCIRVLLGCVALVKSHLPDVGIEALSVAEKYWLEQSLSSDQLEAERIKCWNYLDERGASTNTQDKEYCALRAVICLLHAQQPSDDIGELIEFFLEMVDSITNDLALVDKTVRKFLN